MYFIGGRGRQQHNDAEGQAIRRGCHCECWPVYLCMYLPTMCVRVPLIGNGGVEFVPLQTISNVVIRHSSFTRRALRDPQGSFVSYLDPLCQIKLKL